MANTAKKVEEPKQATEETPVVAVEDTQATDSKAEGGKVYNFTSTNKFLSCVGLGVQFMNGKASTTSLEVAKELVKIDGVELVEK